MAAAATAATEDEEGISHLNGKTINFKTISLRRSGTTDKSSLSISLRHFTLI